MDRGQRCKPPDETKRRRSDGDHFRTEQELHGELHGELHSGGSAAQLANFMQTLSDAMGQAVVTPITTAMSALPSQMAAAVRVYDEAEAMRRAAAAEETNLERQIERCM
eukprot:4083601-Prymnesium_polylepis.1